MSDVDSLRDHYHGFFLTGPVGNNAFSYDQRETKTLYVPPIIEGGLEDLSVGIGTAFSEIHDGQEIDAFGLNDFLYMLWQDKDVFIFDNHNHAFFFWNYENLAGRIPRELKLVHVDQHKDSRPPAIPFAGNDNLAEVFDYTNFVLNVGNFIPPALDAGIFSGIVNVTTLDDFKNSIEPPFALDLDMDIFAPDMDYIPYEMKIERIREWMKNASAVTIATSPYFMDQTTAIAHIKKIFSKV